MLLTLQSSRRFLPGVWATIPIDPLVLAGCGEGCEFTDSVRMGAWCEWVCPQTPGARERCHRSEAKELGGCGPRGAGTGQRWPLPSPLFREFPAGVALSQALGQWQRYGPSPEARCPLRPYVPDSGSLLSPGSFSPQESGKGHEGGTETTWGPMALKRQE